MLKIIAGLQSPTSGVVATPKDLTIGYLPQQMVITDERTVVEEVRTVFGHLDEMKSRLAGVSFGHNENAEKALTPILEDESIFGVSLVKAGLADSVIEHFKRMNAAPGAVRAEIHSVAIA